jgi:16S rRNA (guanine(527)-N(7))-methyltransferase RsmG
MINKEFLHKCAKCFDIELSPKMLEQFDDYASILVEWNEKMNLTGIVEPDEIVIKHFVDSLCLLKAYNLPQNAKLIDVGTGAGFPAIPLKIARPDIDIVLLDSLNKRLNFLNEVCDRIKINSATVHARAEEAGQKNDYREKFDVATARAVASLNNLCEFCLPFVKVGGRLVLLKGYEVEEELEQAQNAIKVLGAKLEKVEKFELPDQSKRAIIVIEKIKQTEKKYPRQSAKIKKSPL